MKILLGKKIDLRKSYGEPWLRHRICMNCSVRPETSMNNAHAIIQIIDNRGLLARIIDNPTIKGPMILMVYFCPQCTAAIVLWNQKE